MKPLPETHNLPPLSSHGRSDNLGRRLFVNFSSLVGERVIGLFSSLIVTLLLTRYLGTTGYGQYSLVVSHTLLFLPFSSWGVDHICLRDLARRREDAAVILGKVLGLRIVLGLVAFVTAIGTATLLAYPPYLILGVAIFSASLVTSPFDVGGLLFQARLKSQYVAAGSVFASVATLVLVFLGTNLGWGVLALVGVAAAGNFMRSVGVFLLAQRQVRFRLSWDHRYTLYLLREATPLALAGFLMTVNMRFDVVLLSKLHGAHAAALYAAPFAFFFALCFLPQALAGSFFPLLSQAYPADLTRVRQLFESALFYTWLVAFPLFLGGFVVAADLVPFLFGQDFAAAVPVFQVLCVGQILGFGTPLLGQMVLAVGAQRQNLRLLFWITLGGVLSNLLLISRLGQIGAAITNLLVATALFLLTIRLLRSFVQVHLPTGQLWRIAIPSTAMVLILLYLPPMHVIGQVFTGAAVYMLFLGLCTNRFRGVILSNTASLKEQGYSEETGHRRFGVSRKAAVFLNATEMCTQNFKRPLLQRGWQVQELMCTNWREVAQGLIAYLRAVRRGRFVVAGMCFPWQGPWLLAARLLGRKVVLHCPMDVTVRPFPEAWHWKKMIGFFSRRADCFVTLASRSYMIGKLGLRPERVVFLEHCPDLDVIERGRRAEPQFRFPQGSFRLCYSGVAEWQRIDRFVPIFRALRAKTPHVFWLVVSDLHEPMIMRLRKRADDLGVSEAIHCMPIIKPQENYLATVASCDLFVAHMDDESLLGRHELRVQLLEVGALGKPVISVATPALALHGFADGHNIILIDPNDPEESANQIARYITSPGELERIGANLRDHVLERFALAEGIDRLLGFIDRSPLR